MKFNMLKRSLYIFIWLVLPICSFGNDNAHQLFEKGNTLTHESHQPSCQLALTDVSRSVNRSI